MERVTKDGFSWYAPLGIDVPIAFFDRAISAKNTASYEVPLTKCFGAQRLIVLRQTHSIIVKNVEEVCQSTTVLEGDGYYGKRGGSQRYLLGIVTADCLPLVIGNEQEFAFLHVGWRGLAHGIVEVALAHFKGSVDFAIFGPHAGAATYEVGREILSEFKHPPVWLPHANLSKCYLSVADSVLAIVKQHSVQVTPFNGFPCTMQDKNFFSVRREGASTGRNLSVLRI